MVSAPCSGVRMNGRVTVRTTGIHCLTPSVSAQPGCMAWTKMPSGCSRLAHSCVRATMAMLVVAAAVLRGRDASPLTAVQADPGGLLGRGAAVAFALALLASGLPSVLIPLVVLTSRRAVMGALVNRLVTTMTATVVTAAVIGLNGVLLYLAVTA